jgi:nicotinamidase-related amidase
MSKMINVHLVIIDPQKDFVDPKGALYVKGAEKDMDRLTKFVNRATQKLEDIHVTLDSHHLLDCAHPGFWRDSNGNPPNPFTIIAATEIEQGRWTMT